MGKNYVVNQNKPMSGEAIAKEIGISRQAVSASLKRSMTKMYKLVLRKGWADNPFDAVIVIMTCLGADKGDKVEMDAFLKMLSKDIREKVILDAKQRFNI